MKKKLIKCDEVTGSNIAVKSDEGYYVSPAVHYLLFNDPESTNTIINQLKVIDLNDLIEDELLLIAQQQGMKEIK